MVHLRGTIRTFALSAMLATLPATAQDAAPDRSQDVAWHNQQMRALAERYSRTGWNVTHSGLRWRLIARTGADISAGQRPGPTDNVTVHYVGTFTDGEEFDSSVARGQPATFPLNRVIPGWTEGVQLMSVGDTVEFAIPMDLAYGPTGRGPIPGGATLLFTVELLGIERAGE